MSAPVVQPTSPQAISDQLAAALAGGLTLAGATAILSNLAGAGLVNVVKALAADKGRLAGMLAIPRVPLAQAGETSKARVRRLGAQAAVKARAGYLTAAVGRLSAAYATGDPAVIKDAVDTERRYAIGHNAATAGRKRATSNVAKMIGKRVPDSAGELLLGWYTHLSDATCARCRAAGGTNFDALSVPPIGWPGMVHPHDHCLPGPPHNTDRRTEDVSVNLRASQLEFGRGSKLWKYWTGAKGTARYAGSPTPWTTLRDALISEGVPATQADGLATNIMLATPAGRALFKAHHQGGTKGRSIMKAETRAAVIIEVRGDKPDEKPGFTVRAVNYNVPDTYRTSWAPGVFTEALSQRANMPVVWNHDQGDPVGHVVAHRESPDGLDLDVEFDDFDAVPRARQAHAQTRSGTMAQMSFAFVRGEEEEDPGHRGVMRQTKAGLREFSLVLNGAVPGTKVTSVRSDAPQMLSSERAADVVRRFESGALTLDAALLELRSPDQPDDDVDGPRFEFRAVDGTTGEPDAGEAGPMAVLTAVDGLMVSVAAALDKQDLEAARQFFSAAAYRLAELQCLLGMTPAVDDTVTYSWRVAEPAETRSAEEPGDDPVLALLDSLNVGPDSPRMGYGAPGAVLAMSVPTRATGSATAAKPYGKVKYADTGYQKDGKARYPLDTKDHVQAAWSYINQDKNASQYSSADLKKVKSAIMSAAKKFGITISSGAK